MALSQQIWVGISDNYNDSANVAPYTLLQSFCLPCLHQCREICSACGGDRLPDHFTVLPLTLHGLHLQAGDAVFANTSLNSNSSATDNITDDGAVLNASKADFNNYQMPTYYLDVRVVDHSGLATSVKSGGLVLDTSPPEFKSVRCFDPEFSNDVEITLLGNNHTVGVTWEVAEDISDVKTVKVSLGTGPGLSDLVSPASVGKDQVQHVFTGLHSLLHEGQQYFITLEAENEAGLFSQAFSNFTVDTAPPDMASMRVHVGNVTSVEVGGVVLGVMEDTQNLELDLDLDLDLLDELNVEYYG